MGKKLHGSDRSQFEDNVPAFKCQLLENPQLGQPVSEPVFTNRTSSVYETRLPAILGLYEDVRSKAIS